MYGSKKGLAPGIIPGKEVYEVSQKTVNIREQVIEDFTTGLRIEFKVKDDGESQLRLSGTILPFGNRELLFDKDGEYVGAGTLV